ncbi:MAG TPA: YeeE/YedE family protein [Nevskiaceae bacterium]|nr:YeeE/YedE family protein [Nevskiaceae bacterium]
MNTRMLNTVVALLVGTLFGLGLAVSGMIDPAKVINFLDVTGHWDPTLAFVMGGALLVTLPAYQLAKRRKAPLLAERFDLPTKTVIDRPLVIGAAVFGLGWGLGGFCPGPAIAALGTLQAPVFGFFIAMLVGQWLADRASGLSVLHHTPSCALGSKSSTPTTAGATAAHES